MSEEANLTPELTAVRSSVAAKMINLFVSPTPVFEEVADSPPNVINWAAPMILVCLSSLFMVEVTASPELTAAGIQQLLQDGRVTEAQAALLSARWMGIARLAVCLSVIVGTVWSALVLWLVGRFLLKRTFSFAKALEVAGLSATILVLGGVITGLLALAIGDSSARPALSLLCSGLAGDNPLRPISGVLNVLHFWVAGVLSVGLAQLSRVTIKEAAFWVFGFWIFAHIALLVLA